MGNFSDATKLFGADAMALLDIAGRDVRINELTHSLLAKCEHRSGKGTLVCIGPHGTGRALKKQATLQGQDGAEIRQVYCRRHLDARLLAALWAVHGPEADRPTENQGR